MRTSPAVFVFLMAMIASTSALAQNVYVGVGAGQVSADIDCELDITCSVDDSDTGYKVFAGYKFTPNFALEGAYIDGGEVSESGTDSFLGTASGKIETTGFNIAAVGIWPVSKRFSIQGKAGVFIWDMDISVDSSSQGSASQSESGNAGMFGVGATFYFTERFGVLVEYEKFLNVGNADVTGESDVDFASASLVVTF